MTFWSWQFSVFYQTVFTDTSNHAEIQLVACDRYYYFIFIIYKCKQNVTWTCNWCLWKRQILYANWGFSNNNKNVVFYIIYKNLNSKKNVCCIDASFVNILWLIPERSASGFGCIVWDDCPAGRPVIIAKMAWYFHVVLSRYQNFSIRYQYQWKSTVLGTNFGTKAKHKNMLIKKHIFINKVKQK